VRQVAERLVRQADYNINTRMILNEIYEKSPAAYQDLSQDNSQLKLGDLRKTRLTLRQLNKLRQMQDVRGYEYKEKLKLVRQQYAPPPVAPGL
jgi:hypothetical protein